MIFFCFANAQKVATYVHRNIKHLTHCCVAMINLFKHSITTLIWNVNSIWMEVGLTIEYLMIATLSCRWMEIAYHWVARSDSFLIFCYALCQMPMEQEEAVKPTTTYGEYCISCCSHKLWFSKEVNSTKFGREEALIALKAFHSSSKNLLNPKFPWRVFLRNKL